MVTVYSVATRILAFLFKIYLSRKLGAEVVGLYQICLSLYFLALSFAASGLPMVLSRRIAEDSANGGKKAGAYLSAVMIMSLAASLIIIALFYLFKNQLSFMFSDERALPLFLIMLPALVSTCVYTSVRSWFWGRRDYNSFSFAEMLEEVLRILFSLLLTAGLASKLSGAIGIAWAFLLSDIACAAALLIMFFRKKGRFLKPEGFREIYKSSTPITAMRSFGSVVNSLTALIIPAKLVAMGLSAHEATAAFGRVMGIAMPLIMAPTMLSSALVIVLVPEIAAASSKNDSTLLRSRIDGSLLFSIIISCLFTVLYSALGEEIGLIVFNDATAGEYVSKTALLMFPIGIAQITTSTLNSMGMEKKSFYNYLYGAAFLLICILVLPRFMGTYAIAVGLGGNHLIVSALNLKLIRKKVNIGQNLKSMLFSAAFTAPCCLLAYFLKGIFLNLMPKLPAVILSGGIPMGIFIVFLVVFKIVDVEKFYKKRKPAAQSEKHINSGLKVFHL